MIKLVFGGHVSAKRFEVNVMHLRLCRALAMLATCAGLSPLVAAESRRLTIVADFQGPYSQGSIDQMKSELSGILKDSGLVIEWKSLSEARGETFADLVVVHFKGKCMLEPVAY